MERGFRPTSLLLQKQPHSKWSERDFIIFEAYETYRAEHSDSHGEATYITKSGDAQLNVLVRDRTDVADEALQQFDESNNKKKKPPKGVTRWAELVYVEEGVSVPVPRGGLARKRYLDLSEEITKAEATDLAADLDIEREKPRTGYNPSYYGDGI